MKSEYLRKIGIKFSSDDDMFYTSEQISEFIIEKEKYGIDIRETYDCMYSLVEYLYVLLNRYIDRASEIIDFHYTPIKVDGVKWYQDEILDVIINGLKQWLLMYHDDNGYELIYRPDCAVRKHCEWCINFFLKVNERMWW